VSLGIKPLTGKQLLSVEAADRRLNIWEGSVRSGKSVAADLRWLKFVRHGPPGNLLMAGKTERTLKRNVIDPLTDVLGRAHCSYALGSGELRLLGRRVYVAGANDERAQEKIRGITLVGTYVDEASTLPESFWTMLLSRLSVDGAQLFATTNPEGPQHWLKVDYLDHAAVWVRGDGEMVTGDDEALDLARFSFRLPDNPHLPPDYVSAISREYSGLWRRRLIEGEWCVAAGAVYEEWDPSSHVVPAAALPPVARTLSVGIDYGTTHPTRGYLLGVSAEPRPRLVVMDEWAPPKMTDSGLSADYRRWVAGRCPEWVCVDPAAASFKLQLFSDGLANVMDAHNAVLDGIRTIASLLATGTLIVSDACAELVKEIPGYVWDPKATARGEDAPLKANDDSCDALRYAVASTRALWGGLVPMTLPTDLEAA
jgi:PBSX family phage terminase large subunit